MTRIEQLKQFIVEDPNDPFPRYALALEYLRDKPAWAQQVFEELLITFPDYLPVYYPAAHYYIEHGHSEKGELLFHQGINLAKKQGDAKTEHELKQAYNQWLDESRE